MGNKNRNKNRSSIPNLKKNHLMMLWYIHKRLNPLSIANELGKSPSTISEHLKNLVNRGFIELEFKSNITIYKLTKKGKDAISVFLKTSEEGQPMILDRSHNIKLKSKIIRFPNEWGGEWKEKEMTNWIEYSMWFNNILVVRTTKNILFQIPEIYYKSSDESLLETGRLVNELINYLEEKFIGLKVGTPEVVSHIITQHHAIPNDPFAKYMGDKNITYKDDRVMIDHSKGMVEKEFIHPKYSPDDWENEIKHLRDRLNPETPTNTELARISSENMLKNEELAQITKENAETVKGMLEYQKSSIGGVNEVINKLGEQIESHLALIQEYREENIAWRKDTEEKIRKDLEENNKGFFKKLIGKFKGGFKASQSNM